MKTDCGIALLSLAFIAAGAVVASQPGYETAPTFSEGLRRGFAHCGAGLFIGFGFLGLLASVVSIIGRVRDRFRKGE